jgi:WYL domain
MSVKSLYELNAKRGGAALRARIRHIDDRLFWFGFVNLADHVAKFGISDVQGKIDLHTYRNLSSTPPPERKPGRSTATAPQQTNRPRFYERPEPFVALFDGPRSLDDLMTTKLSDVDVLTPLPMEAVYLPRRSVDADCVRAVLAATELKESCSIHYQSMTSKNSSSRVISPHALVKASGRWHVRAFDFTRRSFIDFSLSRIRESSPAAEHPVVPGDIDDDWKEMVVVQFIAHPSLHENQKRAVADEFGMVDGVLNIQVRRALLFYLLDEMRILTAVRSGDMKAARSAAVWIQDAAQVSAELQKMEISRNAKASQ